MTTFKLDTSGEVLICEWSGTHWPDLSPFVQGYVEALLTDLIQRQTDAGRFSQLDIRFSDLAPETLARIMEDCERASRSMAAVEMDWAVDLAEYGEVFWAQRNMALLPEFPPITPFLDENGKINLRETNQ